FDNEFAPYLRRIFYLKPEKEIEADASAIEYFGVFNLTDVRAPERKLWYVYYCKKSEIDDTVDRIFQKYGKKNLCEIFRKPVFSGLSLRSRVKSHFSEQKWYVKGNLLEAPPKGRYNDERMAKAIGDLYNAEQLKIYNYIGMKYNQNKSYVKNY
ncbi:CG33469, partial [Drosophila busckii]